MGLRDQGVLLEVQHEQVQRDPRGLQGLGGTQVFQDRLRTLGLQDPQAKEVIQASLGQLDLLGHRVTWGHKGPSVRKVGWGSKGM